MREANKETDSTLENKPRVAAGQGHGGRVKWVMGIKEGTCDEHWVLYATDESLNSSPEPNGTLYVN